MRNAYWQKWGLFISSYFPLYLWLIFSQLNYSKNIKIQLTNMNGLIFYGILFLFSIIAIVQIVILLRMNGSQRDPLPKKLQVEPESDSLMNYVITYIMPFLTLNINDTKSLIGNLFLFLVIGSIYVGSSATFLNPILGLLGYKVFGVSGYKNGHHLISKLSFDELETARNNGESVLTYRIGEGIYLVKGAPHA